MTDIAGMEKPGWSNSDAAKHAPDDVRPEVETPKPFEPGSSNVKGVKTTEVEPVEHAIADTDGTDDDKAAEAAKKTSPRKSSSRKR